MYKQFANVIKSSSIASSIAIPTEFLLNTTDNHTVMIAHWQIGNQQFNIIRCYQHLHCCLLVFIQQEVNFWFSRIEVALSVLKKKKIPTPWKT